MVIFVRSSISVKDSQSLLADSQTLAGIKKTPRGASFRFLCPAYEKLLGGIYSHPIGQSSEFGKIGSR